MRSKREKDEKKLSAVAAVAGTTLSNLNHHRYNQLQPATKLGVYFRFFSFQILFFFQLVFRYARLLSSAQMKMVLHKENLSKHKHTHTKLLLIAVVVAIDRQVAI